MAGKSPLKASAEQKLGLETLAASRDRGEADRARAVLLTLAGWSSQRASAAPPALGQPRHDHAKPREFPTPASVLRLPSMEICPPCHAPANHCKDAITTLIR